MGFEAFRRACVVLLMPPLAGCANPIGCITGAPAALIQPSWTFFVTHASDAPVEVTGLFTSGVQPPCEADDGWYGARQALTASVSAGGRPVFARQDALWQFRTQLARTVPTLPMIRFWDRPPEPQPAYRITMTDDKGRLMPGDLSAGVDLAPATGPLPGLTVDAPASNAPTLRWTGIRPEDAVNVYIEPADAPWEWPVHPRFWAPAGVTALTLAGKLPEPRSPQIQRGFTLAGGRDYLARVARVVTRTEGPVVTYYLHLSAAVRLSPAATISVP